MTDKIFKVARTQKDLPPSDLRGEILRYIEERWNALNRQHEQGRMEYYEFLILIRELGNMKKWVEENVNE